MDPSAPEPPLPNKAEREAAEALAAACRGAEATFCVGGTVKPADLPTGIRIAYKTQKASKADSDSPAAGMACLPAAANSAALRGLLGASRPAHFGRGKAKVLDPEYRQAVAMHREDCAASFDPAEHGIVHTIHQVMLPEAGFVSSHLDKLNVYTEGGFFKPHVDTPRQGAAQFGTLIVCLPVGFEGGELVVSHGGRTVEYAWGEGAAEGEVQWAAVYSDCRHEVLPVRAGARVTLTYDLVGDLLLERRLN